MKLAMYLRLSKDDGSTDESNSIKSQRNIIKEYIFSNPDLRRYECVEFKDDGISGKREDRPEFTRMIDLIRKQEIQCVIVKDMSRFSRDQLIAGKYREQIFPFLGVRFIAVTDHYDSINYIGAYGEIDIAFKEILNDMYSEDLSDKVKSALDIRRGNGKYICEKPPYGYRKSETDRYQLVVDEPAAKVIRRIYKEYIAGKSMYTLSKELNRNGIPCPAKYMQESGIFVSDKKNYSGSVWTVASVSRILHNEVYIGNLMYGKSRAKDTGLKQKVNISRDEWKRVEGTHKAIIDKKQFNKVQERLSGNKKVGALSVDTETDIESCTKISSENCNDTEKVSLRGLVYCKGCGKKLYYDKSGRSRFCCTMRYTDKPHDRCLVSIRNEDLEGVVISEIQKYIETCVDFEKVRKLNRIKIQNSKAKLKKDIDKQSGMITRIKDELKNSFEAFASGRITKTEYLEFKSKTDVVLEDSGKKLSKLETKLQDLLREEAESYNGLHVTKDMMKIDALSKELAELLIDKIIVSQDKQIDILWKFTPELRVVS